MTFVPWRAPRAGEKYEVSYVFDQDGDRRYRVGFIRGRLAAFARWLVSGNAHGFWVIADGAKDPLVEGLSEEAAYRLANELNGQRVAIELNHETIARQHDWGTKTEAVLAECREYFDNKSDAEVVDGYPRQNAELRLRTLIDTVLPASERKPDGVFRTLHGSPPTLDMEPDHSIPEGDDEGEQMGYGTPSQEEYEHEQELERQQARQDALVDSYQHGDSRDMRHPQDEGFA